MATVLKGYIVDKKTGKIVKDRRRLDTSVKIRQRTSKKQTAVPPAKAGHTA